MRLWKHLLWVLVLAALGTRPVLGDNLKPAAGKQQAQTLARDVTTQVKLNYLLFLPEGYDTSEKPWPLMLFLHGAGESGDNLNRVKVHGPPKLVESKKDFPFILVSPQSPRFGWDVVALNALLDEVVSKYRVDPDRVYVTGLSMGGFGTWALASAYPERFAAVAPICGGGESIMARKIGHIPEWVFHGALDDVVPLERSATMVRALKKAGAEVRFTVYPDAGHDSWTETYANPQLYEWLLRHRRQKGN